MMDQIAGCTRLIVSSKSEERKNSYCARSATETSASFHQRHILGDRDIGFVSIRLHELLKPAQMLPESAWWSRVSVIPPGRPQTPQTGADATGECVVEQSVRDPTRKTTDSVLKFSYRFDEKLLHLCRRNFMTQACSVRCHIV